MEIHIDTGSGFCFGVQRAILLAEEALDEGNDIYCLGEMVHNPIQVKKLKDKGLKVISQSDFSEVEGKTVFLRSHGEPPSTYKAAEDAGIHLVDATCPIVLKLQQKIKLTFSEGISSNVQIVIFGKPTHAEVIGLNGIIHGNAIVIFDYQDINKIDPLKPVHLFSQTTMDSSSYSELGVKIQQYLLDAGNENFTFHRSVCSQVSARIPQLREFALKNDVILFVSGANSSNGTFLFAECYKVNSRSYRINSETDIDLNWLKDAENIGISGATSTPSWLIKQVADYLAISFK